VHGALLARTRPNTWRWRNHEASLPGGDAGGGRGGAWPALAETTLSAYVGFSFTHASDVRLRQPGGTDLTFQGVSWTSRSLELPLYYGVRITHYFAARPDWGLMLDFVHDKVYANTEAARRVTGTREGHPVEALEPLGASLQRFNMSHGTNYLTLNLLRRWNACAKPGCAGRLQPYVAVGGGLVIPHVEAALGEHSVSEYQVDGPSLQLLGGLTIPFASRWSLFGEYRLSRASLSVDVPGGELSTSLNTHHMIAGPSFRLPIP
jgi:hypothetical protein